MTINSNNTPDSNELRLLIAKNLDFIQVSLNNYLSGNDLNELEGILTRLGRGGKIPHWYEGLSQRLVPNYDGKTIGSIVEMMLLATIEKKVLCGIPGLPTLMINPAKGVDFPQLGLGVKSPSDNFCTSEPFFSTYERLLGNMHDSLVLLTNYQDDSFKRKESALAIKSTKFLCGSELADKNLCILAKKNRDFLLGKNETLCKKFIQFLAHVNQSSFLANYLIDLIKVLQGSKDEIDSVVSSINKKFNDKIKKQIDKGEVPFDKGLIDEILKIKDTPHQVEAIINCCNDWVIDNHKEFARVPNDNEWERFIASPLNGKISISFALQWRYNFASVF
ncbi:hypothetical protein SNR26_19800 [Pectobacterium brasiliense]|uniref:hypothetical protein n=1 Tax=Pectobacterium brasiliense TaxID=180957 RepID=UPI002A7EBCFD|nr:hypothetical protein [Pectobacterium brasiliense]MDY4369951.1 hypothetical protein [Pectobacterium brasiliense]MDY7059483.1 hypothetical protein [Pectobacterium brasiliense]